MLITSNKPCYCNILGALDGHIIGHWLKRKKRRNQNENSAFNNLFNSLFDNATFRQVTKTKKDGSTYPGLSIRVNDQEISEEEEE